MNANKVDALIVLSSRRGLRKDPIESNFEQLSGLVTRSDIFKTPVENIKAMNHTNIGRVMTPSYELYTVSTDENIYSCYSKMLDKKIHHLIVTRNERDIVGVVNFRDVARACMGESLEMQRKCLSAMAQISDVGQLEDEEDLIAPAVYAFPKTCADTLMGYDGETINNIQQTSQAWLQVLRKTSSGHRFIVIDGVSEHRTTAKLMIEQIIGHQLKLVSLPLS